MSLHDVDKAGGNRSQPTLNTADVVQGRMAHGTFGVTLVDTSSSVQARVVIVDGNIEVYKSDNTLIFRGGVRPTDSDGAIDMAKPGGAL